MDEPIATVVVPTSVQVLPSGDEYAENVEPARTTRTQNGAADNGPGVLVLVPPVDVRRWNTRPFAAETNIDAWRAFAASDSRNMTPAFVHTSTFCTDATRAVMSPSPVMGWYTKLNASAAPQMSAPAPATV